MDFFNNYFELISIKIRQVVSEELANAAQTIKRTDGQGNKVIIAGNGGSAAMASHLAVDFTKAAGIRTVCFNEPSLITCFANDYGYEHWLEQALVQYADPGDLLLLISSSGTSKNIVNAACKAKELKLSLITFSGFAENNPLRQLGDINFWVDSCGYNIVEMTHHIWAVAIVDYINGSIEYSA